MREGLRGAGAEADGPAFLPARTALGHQDAASSQLAAEGGDRHLGNAARGAPPGEVRMEVSGGRLVAGGGGAECAAGFQPLVDQPGAVVLPGCFGPIGLLLSLFHLTPKHNIKNTTPQTHRQYSRAHALAPRHARPLRPHAGFTVRNCPAIRFFYDFRMMRGG